MHRLVLSALLLTLPISAIAAPTWDKMKAATWTEVSSANHKDAGKIAIKKATVGELECWGGEANVAVSRDKLMEVVKDVPSATKWSTAGITTSELLGQSGSDYYFFQYLDVPGWTMSSDRFWFLKGSVSSTSDNSTWQWERLVDGGDYKSRWQQVKSENSSAIEPPTNVGAWSFTTVGAQTNMKYYICTDTGGSIPGFVQSAATKQTLPDTVGDVVREAKKRGG